MLALIPLWGRLIALLALVAAVGGMGAYTGYQHAHGQTVALQAQFDTFKAETAALGKVAEAHTAAVEAKQKEITDALTADYSRRLAALPKFGGVRQPTNPGGGEISLVSCPAPGAHAAAADAVFVAQADFDTLATLAARTTQMLVSLQDWIRQQQADYGPAETPRTPPGWNQ